MAERRHKTRRTEHRPNTLYFVEQLYQQLVLAQFLLAFLLEVGVDSGVHAFEVRHKTSHHTARKTAAYQQGRHESVLRIDPITQEIIDELLRQAARLHIGLHIDVLYEEACVFEHGLNGDDIRMHLTPTQRLHRYVQHIAAGFGYFEHRSHAKARARMAVVLDDDIGVFLFDSRYDRTKHCRTTDTGHIFQTDFLRTSFDQLLREVDIILHRVYL